MDEQDMDFLAAEQGHDSGDVVAVLWGQHECHDAVFGEEWGWCWHGSFSGMSYQFVLCIVDSLAG